MARITIDPEMACEQIALEPDACCEYICFEVGDYSPTFVTDLPDYSGVTTVTPSMDAQTLETANTALHDNITVEAIPYDEVEAATPVISVDSGGKVTATTNQQGGIVESSTKSAEYQQTIIEQATPDISVASDGVITATATQTGGFVAGGSKTATLAQETVEQATPTISVDNAGKITASATQTAGFVSAGTKSTTYSLPTQGATTITPTESAQTAVAAGKWTTGIVQVSAIPSEYIKPSGTLPITQNGTYDVKSYANTSVSVPGIVPTGTLPISANGTYDVTNYASANVGVPIIETEAITIAENGVYTASSGHAYTPVTVNVTGGGGTVTLIAEQALGTISTTSTTARDTGKTVTVSGADSYDFLFVEISQKEVTNNRHIATVRSCVLTTPSGGSKTDIYNMNYVWNCKNTTNGYVTHAATYGVYPSSSSLSDGVATFSIYTRYDEVTTGTINGDYTARVYGVNLIDLIGG